MEGREDYYGYDLAGEVGSEGVPSTKLGEQIHRDPLLPMYREDLVARLKSVIGVGKKASETTVQSHFQRGLFMKILDVERVEGREILISF